MASDLEKLPLFRKITALPRAGAAAAVEPSTAPASAVSPASATAVRSSAVAYPASEVTLSSPVRAARAEEPPAQDSLSVHVTVDRGLVGLLRKQVADELANQLTGREGVGDEDRREMGRALIARIVREDALAKSQAGIAPRSPAEEDALRQAIFDANFGLGPLQPLVDNQRLDNVEISGYDNVWLELEGGVLERGPAVTDSNEELIEFLQFLASQHGRSFNPTSPSLDLSIGNSARINATAWLGGPPDVVIRRHSKKNTNLTDLVNLGLLTEGMAQFLRAAVLARRDIVISGQGGAGKTTLTRALCHCIPWHERIATIETDLELFLHEFPDQHRSVWFAEARPGSSERGADGKRVGEISLDWLLTVGLRKNLSRLIVGEMRGWEIMAAIRAMQANAATLSTVHAEDGRGAIDRMVSMMMAPENGQVSPVYAAEQVSTHVDLVVQIDVLDERWRGGGRHRFVSEIFEVEPSSGRATGTSIFAPGPDGRAVYTHSPSETLLRQLERVGFDRKWLQDANWAQPLSTPAALHAVNE